MAAGVVQVKWYATGFRGDDLEAALQQLAPLSLRHGARRYEVFRSRDDRYSFLMSIEFDHKHDWDSFWFGEDFTDMRAACSGWYQIPLLYVWNDLVAVGGMGAEAQADLEGERAPTSLGAEGGTG